MSELNQLTSERRELNEKINSYDKSKPDNVKKSQQVLGTKMPQDEDELDQMLAYWENVLHTKTLSNSEEESIMKKINNLECFRSSLADFSNISKEVADYKKKIQKLSAHIKEKKQVLDNLNKQIDSLNNVVNTYNEKVQGDTEKERGEIDKLKEKIKTVHEKIKTLRTDKQRIIAKYNAEFEIKKSYEAIRRNLEKARQWKEYIAKDEERKALQLEEEKKRKENQMSEFEVNATFGRQLRHKLEALKKAGGKKIVYELDVVQLFTKVGIRQLPKKVNEIDGTLELVNNYITEQEKLEEERKKNEE